MTTPEQTLPTEIQDALQAHENAKEKYLAIRERLVALGERIAKHRATATAAQAESALAGETWRTQFRAADGQLTKDIKQLKRQELDTRELAEEYASLAEELQPSFDLLQIDTAVARDTYLKCQRNAYSLFCDFQVKASAATLLALPEAKPMLEALRHKRSLIGQEVDADGSFDHSPMTAERKAIRAVKDYRFAKLLFDEIERAFTTLEEPGAAIQWEGLQVIHVTDIEGNQGKMTNPLYRSRRSIELKTQLGLTAITASA